MASAGSTNGLGGGLLRGASSGFTLVEVLHVVILVAILAGILAPRIDVAGSRADSAVLRLNALLTQAQRRALLRQHDVRVLFDRDGAVVRLHDDVDNDGAVDTGERFVVSELGEGVTFGRAGAGPLPGGPSDVVSFAADPDLNAPVLTFHRNGSASERGTLHLEALPGTDPATARALRVERATGAATCWSHRAGSWEERC